MITTQRVLKLTVASAALGAAVLTCAPVASAGSADDRGNSIRTVPNTSTAVTVISPTATYNGSKYVGAACPSSTSGYATWEFGPVSPTSAYLKKVTFKATSGTFDPHFAITDNQGRNVPLTVGSTSPTTAVYNVNRSVAFGTNGIKLTQSVNAPSHCGFTPELYFRVTRS